VSLVRGDFTSARQTDDRSAACDWMADVCNACSTFHEIMQHELPLQLGYYIDHRPHPYVAEPEHVEEHSAADRCEEHDECEARESICEVRQSGLDDVITDKLRSDAEADKREHQKIVWNSSSACADITPPSGGNDDSSTRWAEIETPRSSGALLSLPFRAASPALAGTLTRHDAPTHDARCGLSYGGTASIVNAAS